MPDFLEAAAQRGGGDTRRSRWGGKGGKGGKGSGKGKGGGKGKGKGKGKW